MHNAGWVHCDVKSRNFLRLTDPRFVDLTLNDFSSARCASDESLKRDDFVGLIESALVLYHHGEELDSAVEAMRPTARSLDLESYLDGMFQFPAWTYHSLFLFDSLVLPPARKRRHVA
jgi:hypothetical protein